MIWMMLSLLSGPVRAQEHSVVVTQDVIVTSLRKKEVRRLFTGQSGAWPDGRSVNLILPPLDSAAMIWLSAEVLGLSPDLYHRYLLEKAYRAGRPPPQIADSTETILKDAQSSGATLTVLPLPVGGGFVVVRIN